MTLDLVKPSLEYLPGYHAALDRGWSPDNLATERKRQEELSKIAADSADFVASLYDPEAKAGPVILTDGATVPRLPSFTYWIWDGEFCGHMSFRWQNGTTDLPPTCLGHIGYSVVPWKQRRGYAKEGLRLILVKARQLLPYVEVTTDFDNVASQKTVLANGGYLVKEFLPPSNFSQTVHHLYRINLTP